ncbi:MAG: sigma-70 family RNA polymerase sigma factor [Bacteroidetes bacterium]|nr:sigma-70 family RNA polymerase sigma factor [Bacteroidota bacterium]
MIHSSDKQLFSALREGDNNALSILFLRHYDYLIHYGLRIVAETTIVEECIQDMFVYLFESHERLGKVENVKSYLFKALRRRIFEKLERERRFKKTEGQWLNRSDIRFSENDIFCWEKNQGQSQEVLLTVLNDLPWRQREAIYLRYYNGLSTKEIAAIMGVANQTVLNTLYQALKKVRIHKKLKSLVGFVLAGLLINYPFF